VRFFKLAQFAVHPLEFRIGSAGKLAAVEFSRGFLGAQACLKRLGDGERIENSASGSSKSKRLDHLFGLLLGRLPLAETLAVAARARRSAPPA